MEDRIPLSPEQTLQLRVIYLEYQCAELQAKIMAYEQEAFLRQAQQQREQALIACLAPLQAQLTVPWAACQVDLAQACLRYEGPGDGQGDGAMAADPWRPAS